MNDIIFGLDEILADVISFLPNSPFTTYLVASTDSDITAVLSWVNYFVDVPTMIVIGQTWLVSIAGYFIISAVLRWIKAVQ